MDCDRFDVVIVPFPFTDKAQTKRRPALVLSRHESFGREAGHSVMAMITSAKNPPWPLDTPITDLDIAGLTAASVVRMKLFTLDHRFVLAKRGKLADKDRKSVLRCLRCCSRRSRAAQYASVLPYAGCMSVSWRVTAVCA